MNEVANELINNIETEDDMKGKYLTFFTDEQLFGIPISDVVQIVAIQEITPIPEFPDYAKGIINLRGSIIAVIDMGLRLHKPETEYNERTCIIVTNINDVYVGFIVAAVDEVTEITDDKISPPPKVSNDKANAYLTGVGKMPSGKVVLLMDTTKVLSEDVLETI
ncbi:MAG: chemotaxis protein CheW, partial [Oscillospiraceae bacterium]